ncbi:FAM10 family protein At4g22670-like [Triticum urartu]|uniref:Hsp70-interacting protein N-terminal domain-containing protein n=1 Tax=Triticum urartu TaxID=4572 RepID=A0A8R7QRN4_TRIUA|nr:FAM10 family protein At4g22670-like [Triticum urartu]XP_048538600.1 FAM10 family protein At4g22670-like [Triticum urartu]
MDMSWVGELRAFVEACKKDPALLVDPSLAFLRDYLTSLGADLPAAAAAKSGPKVPTHPTPLISVPINEEDGTDMRDPTVETDELDADIVESDLELEGDVVQPDHSDAPQKMGDPSFEVTEESRDASQKEKGMATEAISEGKLQEAVEHLTKAILLNPTSAMMYATRASVFIKMKKPAAAIRDANAALQINPDSAKGYKTRGMANSMLGKWEEAARDLHAASNIDYDYEIKATLKKVEPNAHKIVEHRRKYDRLWKERNDKKSERDRLRRRAEAQAAYEKERGASNHQVEACLVVSLAVVCLEECVVTFLELPRGCCVPQHQLNTYLRSSMTTI